MKQTQNDNLTSDPPSALLRAVDTVLQVTLIITTKLLLIQSDLVLHVFRRQLI
jgi:hypothetical protein